MPRIHVVGAGVAGLAAAVRMAQRGWRVTLYESAGQAGGRCRSFFDGKLQRTIDNGNHILLSANTAALAYLEAIGSRGTLIAPDTAEFAFVDLESGERWTVAPGNGRVPAWIFDSRRRIPGTRPRHYLEALRLAFAPSDARVSDRLDRASPLWQRFWEPLTLAALNTEPEEAAARLLWLVLRESFAKGGAACRPMIAREGLSATFIDPALALLADGGNEVRLNWRLRALQTNRGRIEALEFDGERIAVGPEDAVILAVPPTAAGALIPGLQAPGETRPIVNAHIKLPKDADLGHLLPGGLPFLGLVRSTAHWLFVRGDVASLTVSAADRLASLPNERIAESLWRDTARALALDPTAVPEIRIIKEKRATFAQSPEMLRRRPPPRTAWRNLLLAGDWIDTGYPATIESAVRSAELACRTLAEAP